MGAVIGWEAEYGSGIQRLGSANMPPRSRIVIVVVDIIRFDDEIPVNAMCQKDFIDITARVCLRRDDIVLGLGKIKPVLRSMVKFEAEFCALVIGEIYTNAG